MRSSGWAKRGGFALLSTPAATSGPQSPATRTGSTASASSSSPAPSTRAWTQRATVPSARSSRLPRSRTASASSLTRKAFPHVCSRTSATRPGLGSRPMTPASSAATASSSSAPRRIRIAAGSPKIASAVAQPGPSCRRASTTATPPRWSSCTVRAASACSEAASERSTSSTATRTGRRPRAARRRGRAARPRAGPLGGRAQAAHHVRVAVQRARAEHERPAGPRPLARLLDEAALAGAGGALDRDQRAGAALCRAQRGVQPAQLLVASMQSDP